MGTIVLRLMFTVGPQMAHVVGPKGEEIYTAEWGRVKVTFPWDRYSGKNEHSSCWIRVAQNWGGTMWGHLAIPRIGHEVIFDFLEGDPDQPIITGRAYHAQNKPPYKLPDHKTKMVIRSDSHKADYIDFNELSFEDEAGEEEVFVHAQKDMNEKVENNFSQRVNVNKVESVGHNKAIEVTNNHSEVIGGDMEIFVGPTQKGRYTPSNAGKNIQGIGNVPYGLGKKASNPLGEGTLQLSVKKDKVESIGNNHLQLIQKKISERKR